MNWVQFGIRFLTGLELLVGFSDGQDRITFRSDDEVTFIDNSERNMKIPEKLLIQMKDVQNVTEFLSRFVAVQEDVIDNERTNIFSRRANAAGVPTVAKPAICEPEMQVVELETPGNGAVFLWPPCVRARRCGGCCTSKMLTCSPIATSPFNVTVLQVLYDPQTPDAFQNQGTRTFSIEQHDRCACKCKQDANSCGNLQQFRQNECRCVCINQDQALQCTGPKKIWDSSDCACKCRRILDCSTGSFFNPLRCSCEASRRSLSSLPASNLSRQNNSISERSRL